jgi:uncharacterized membrane protein
MQSRSPASAVMIAALPIPFPAALFIAALVTDVAYWRTADPLWTTMSSWLLLAGLIMGGGAAFVELGRMLGDPGVRRVGLAWVHMLGIGLAVLLSILNFVFHVRDDYSAVAPVGPLLSGVVVAILLLSGWVEWGLVRRPLAKDA